jgi:hypothetical protein
MTAIRSLTTLAGIALLCAVLAAPAAATNLSCDAVSESDASLWARYIDTGDRVTFDVSVKVPKANKGRLKRRWSVFVDEQQVGQLDLTQRLDGSHSGSLSFDSYAMAGPADAAARAFPGSWAPAGRGAVVRVESLACRLGG